MSNGFAKMPLEESPWIDQHASEDIENYIKYFRELGTSVADLLESDSRTYGPFLNGAQQATERFNITTRGHKITKRTTFRFAEMKERPTSIFIIPDVSRPKAQLPLMELLQYCFAQEMKRHQNKHALVHIIADEAGNQKIPDLDELVTWSRGYGLRFQIYGQNIPALRKTYGKEAVLAILSESEVILFLPGQRDPETLELLEKMLGEGAYVAVGQSANAEAQDFLIGGTNFNEDSRPLLTADEIRRTDKGILFIRRNKPVLVDLPPIGAVEPFRSQIDINPLHGKPFLLPVKLRLNRDKKRKLVGLRTMWRRLFKRRKRELWRQKNFFIRLAQLARFISGCFHIWPVFIIAAFFLSTSSPHVLVNYEYRQHGNGPRNYVSCTYLGLRGFVSPQHAGDCPWLVFINPEASR